MAFFSHAILHDISSTREAADRSSLLRRFFRALLESRQRQADREIARYIDLNGGKLTDSMELEIERRFLPAALGGGRM